VVAAKWPKRSRPPAPLFTPPDIVDRGYSNAGKLDFVSAAVPSFTFDYIITNPPYGERNKLAEKFIEIGLQRITAGKLLALLLPNDFDSAVTRHRFFGGCPPSPARSCSPGALSGSSRRRGNAPDPRKIILGSCGGAGRPRRSREFSTRLNATGRRHERSAERPCVSPKRRNCPNRSGQDQRLSTSA